MTNPLAIFLGSVVLMFNIVFGYYTYRNIKENKPFRKMELFIKKSKERNISNCKNNLQNSEINRKNEKLINSYFFCFFIPSTLPALVFIKCIKNNQFLDVLEWILLFTIIAYTFFHSYLGNKLVGISKLDFLIFNQTTLKELDQALTEDRWTRQVSKIDIMSSVAYLAILDIISLNVLFEPSIGFKLFVRDIILGHTVLTIILFAIFSVFIFWFLMLLSGERTYNWLRRRNRLQKRNLSIYVSMLVTGLVSNLFLFLPLIPYIV